MSNCNPFKISLKSLYSYDDLTDLPSINRVEVRGDLSLEDLGLDTWLTENTSDFITQNDLDEKGFVTKTELNNKGFVTGDELEDSLSEFIVNNYSGGVNQFGFTIESGYSGVMNSTTVDYSQISIYQSIESSNTYMNAQVTPYSVSISNSSGSYSSSTELTPSSGISFYDNSGSATLDLYTLQALIALL